MLTGTEYKSSLRDGRKVWVLGEGDVPDLTAHPATKGLVDEYALWYDRHSDPEWADDLLCDPDEDGVRRPLGLRIPRTAEDLVRLSRSIYAQAIVSAGNATHTPAYGALIALGILDAAEIIGDAGGGRPAVAKAYRDSLERDGFFLTLTGGAAVLGDRFRDPSEHSALRIVKETDAGLVVSGRTGMHTSTPFAHDVYIGLQRPDVNQRAMIAVAVNSPGARVVARRPAARYQTPFMSPLSSRYDELDAHLWLEDVLVPWEKVFAYRFEPPPPEETQQRDRIFCWLVWHHQHSYLARADFTLGLALAVADAMGQRESPAIVARLVDLMIHAQTMRSCLTAATLEPQTSTAGYLYPNPLHLVSSTVYTLSVRQRMAEILRDLPGSSLVITPTDADFEDTEMAAYLEKSFGGGGYTAQQRAALLNLVWDHVSSGLDGRESAFEMHASGGLALWRSRMQRWFDRGNELTRRVLATLDVEMPAVDVEYLRNMAPPGPGQPPAANGRQGSSPGTGAPADLETSKEA
ncbi:MAG TPA: 4-hydroxyphenylacetate 3-hydroxylase N-terminal domain-containing protein [Dehalococcoidia bacterium]|nr:4-hydroxyphenylacetate 3-hydroxylase N-terminal domain-containing protein [Dehalococcoidia bacterium]